MPSTATISPSTSDNYKSEIQTDLSSGWHKQFQSPPVEYRPVPFWSWNEWMEPAEVARQVELMAEAGFGGAFIHARIGLLTKYLGDEWFAACEATLKACRENGLIAWLYDEDKWPSGFSGGSVPLANPDYRHKALIARPVGTIAPAGCTPVGEPNDGLQVYRWLSPLGDAWFNGTTYADLLSREAMRKFLDDAYEPYFERFSEEYGSLIVAQFTDEPCSSYRSRLPKGAIPYSDELPTRFAEMHGYDPIAYMSLLFGEGEGAERFRLHYYQTVSNLFEINFSAQLGQWCEAHGIALTGHYILEGTLYHQKLWGTQIMPHYRHQGIPGIDHLGRQIEERITAKQCQSVANQYGKKRLLSELYGVAGGGLTFEDRWWIATQQITLGVNLLNPHLSLYTMAGCRKRDYPQNLFYQQPWWSLNKAVDEPLSRLCLALSQGRYNAEMLVIHPQQSTFVLWEANAPDGADAQFIGSDWQPVTKDAQKAVHSLDADFQALTNALLGAQRTFDYGDETILGQDGRVEQSELGAQLVIGQMAYPLVVLPSLETIATTTFHLLREFQEAGGTILRSGRAPRLLNGEASSELDNWLETIRFVTIEDVAETLHSVKKPIVETQGIDAADARLLWTHVRDLENGERLIWLVNLNRNRDFETQVCLNGGWGRAEALNVESGDSQAIETKQIENGLQISLPFARTQGHLIHLFPEKSEIYTNGHSGTNGHMNGHGASHRNSAVETAIAIPAEQWSVERLDDNNLTLDYARFKQGTENEWSARPMPVIAIQEMLNQTHYSGSLSLCYGVQVGEFDLSREVHLVLERPENYRVSINGKSVAPSGLPHWRDIRWIPIDITGLLQVGANEIVLECPEFQYGDLGSIHDQVARYGTEIESVYLVGDFGVAAQVTGETPRPDSWERFELPNKIEVRCIAQDSIQLIKPQPLQNGDTVGQGLPFYAGRLQLSASLPIAPQGAKRVTLQFENLDGAVAEIKIDGQVAGNVWAHPLELELPVSALEGGQISLTLFGTLRNLLGPHHHSAGELVQVGPDGFKPSANLTAFDNDYSVWLDKWTNRETAPVDWNDRYCLLAFGETGVISLRYR